MDQSGRRPQRLDSLKPRSQPRKVQKPPSKQCPSCGPDKADIGEEDGVVICRACGTVISETNIVSEVQFVETSTGGHVAIGSYLTNDQAHAAGGLAGLRHVGSGRSHAEAIGKQYNEHG